MVAINYRDRASPDDFIDVTGVSSHARLFGGQKFEFGTIEHLCCYSVRYVNISGWKQESFLLIQSIDIYILFKASKTNNKLNCI